MEPTPALMQSEEWHSKQHPETSKALPQAWACSIVPWETLSSRRRPHHTSLFFHCELDLSEMK